MPGSYLPYVAAAIAAALVGGFGFGAAAFAAFAARVPLGPWWPAVGEAHGHLQLFGWGGLMVLGVGFFFLPRLRGAGLAAPGLLPWILGLFGVGLALRMLAQPAAALFPGSAPTLAMAVSGPLELLAASLAVGLLVATALDGPPLHQRPGLVQVLPFLALAFASLWLALAINAGLTLATGLRGDAILDSAWERLVANLGLAGFLVPISMGMSARTFPLFLLLRPPSAKALALVFAAYVPGLILRLLGEAMGSAGIAAAGKILEGGVFVAFGLLLQVTTPWRRPSRAPMGYVHLAEPVELLLMPSYLWLAIAGLLDLADGVAAFGVLPAMPADAERHALGSGFITLLILGMASRMLPGFGGKQIASKRLLWGTAALGNASVLLRVAPVLLVSIGGSALWPFGPPAAALALSGGLGFGAVACLAANLWMTFRDGAHT